MGFDVWTLLLVTLSSMAAGWMRELVSAVVAFAFAALFHERVYDDQNQHTLTAVVDLLHQRAVYAQRRQAVDGRMRAAGLVVGLTFMAVVDVRRERTPFAVDRSASARVYRWRWLPPLVSDEEPATKCDPTTVRVVRNLAGTSLHFLQEVACPAAIDPAVVRASRAVAARVMAGARQPGGARVVVCGPPGCGKTTAARIVAAELDAYLVPGYDPSKPSSYTLSGIVQNLRFGSNADRTIVFSMDEFEGCLLRIGSPGALPSNGKDAEVTDKASWSGLMDGMQFLENVVVVMSTNLTFGELDGIDRAHGSALLRKGRVTERIDLHCDRKKGKKGRKIAE